MRKLLFLLSAMLFMVQGASAWSGSGSSGDPYLIASSADWETFATSTDEYSDTFFKLTADITVTTMRTKTFSGTFDGGGNTLTFNYTATGDNAAPFAYITGATIKNLRVAGTITTSKKFAAGIVAISNGGTITNCRSSVTIASSTSGDGTHGGLVADSFQGTLDINNCLFDGKLLGENTESCGGIVGWRKQGTLNITNTLFAPAEVTVQGDGGAIFARNGVTSLTNCYYISDWAAATVQGTNANSMTAAALVTALNNGDNKNWCVHRGNAIPVMVNLVINNKTEWDNFSSHAGNYENKYVQLNADISNITAMTSGTFQGIFDGNGHTLTVNLTNSGGNVAPFQYLNGGTIMNLTVTGTVTGGANYCSGLVARTTGGVCLIDNCVVNTNNTGVGFVGGVVAHADNATSLTISNCIYGGTIAIQPNGNDNYSGGILGWYNKDKTLDLVMTNCLFKGDYTGNGQFHPIGVKKWDGIFKSINCTNCYYTKNPANIDDARRTFTDGTKVCELSLGDNIIATGSSCTFDGKTYHLGTVSLSYTPSKSTLFYMIDGNEISGNSFTISKDDHAFDAGAVAITAGDHSITYDYGGPDNTTLYIDGNSNMVAHPWTSEARYSSITSVVIGDGVTSICGNAFKQCPNLTSASIASTVTSIDNQAFSECGKLETVTFTDADNSQLTIIRPNAFANCVKLSSITLPEGVGEIGEFAFVCCSALVSATLPSTLSKMGLHVFRDCTSLASVFCLASTPPTGGSNMFNSNASGRKIYVPAGSVGDYKTAAYWSSYANDILGIQSLTLNENTSNSTAIQNANGQMSEVTLSGRTLYKDGKWNTLCLPFNFSAEQIAAHKDFAGAKLMELNTDGKNGFDATDGTLYLTFKAATAIAAGVPYLVKWDAAGTDFTSPVFFGVTIDATASTTVSDADTGLQEVQMVGCYSPVSVNANDKSILFLGDNNTLYYSTVDRNIRSCRAYFYVPYIDQHPSVKARAFLLDFGDEEATGILEVSADSKEKKDDAWYSLDGVRLSGKPAQRGIYINNGNKVVIK